MADRIHKLRDGTRIRVFRPPRPPGSGFVWLDRDGVLDRTSYTSIDDAIRRLEELALGDEELDLMLQGGGIEPRDTRECHHLDAYDAHGRGDYY